MHSFTYTTLRTTCTMCTTYRQRQRNTRSEHMRTSAHRGPQRALHVHSMCTNTCSVKSSRRYKHRPPRGQPLQGLHKYPHTVQRSDIQQRTPHIPAWPTVSFGSFGRRTKSGRPPEDSPQPWVQYLQDGWVGTHLATWSQALVWSHWLTSWAGTDPSCLQPVPLACQVSTQHDWCSCVH
jgi:hypothetical protein